jgi:hypothetical protein
MYADEAIQRIISVNLVDVSESASKYKSKIEEYCTQNIEQLKEGDIFIFGKFAADVSSQAVTVKDTDELQQKCSDAAKVPSDYRELLIDRCIEYLGGGFGIGILRNLEMAKASFECEFYKERIWQVKKECEEQKNIAEQSYQQAFLLVKVTVNSSFQEGDREFSEEIINQFQQAQQERLGQCIQRIEYLRNLTIQECEERIREAEEKYKQATPDEYKQ